MATNYYLEALTKASKTNPGSGKSICSVSTHVSSSSELEETSTGEFAFIEVRPSDSNICHDAFIVSLDQYSAPPTPPSPKGPQSARPHSPVCFIVSESSKDRDHLEHTVLPSSAIQSQNPLQHAATFHISSSLEKESWSRLAATSDISDTPVTVKNTFIHDIGPEVEHPESSTNWSSCPPMVMTKEFSTKYPKMDTNHIKGDCRPCAYFLMKVDGCRAGGDCHFCHLCPVGAIKKKKKEKVKQLKERDRIERLALMAVA